MQIKGRIIDKQSQPISDVSVEFSTRGIGLGRTETDQQGVYTFPYDESDGRELQIVVSKDGFDKQNVTHHLEGKSGEVQDITLLRKRPTEREQIVEEPPFIPPPWRKPLVVIGMVLLVIVLAIVIKPRRDRAIGQKEGYEVEVQVVLKTKDKDTTLTYKAPGPIRQVSVKLDDDPVQTFVNKEPEGKTFTIQVPPRFRRTLSVTTQIDGQPPQKHEFMSPQEAKARDGADHVFNGVVAMQRIGVAMHSINSPDPKIVAYAKPRLTEWSKDYLSRLEALAASEISSDQLVRLIETFQPNAPYSKEEETAMKLLLPVMKNHYVHFQRMRAPPPNYTNEIYDAYKKIPGTPVDLFNRENKAAGKGR